MTGAGSSTPVCRGTTPARYNFSELGLCRLLPLATAATTRNRYVAPETLNATHDAHLVNLQVS